MSTKQFLSPVEFQKITGLSPATVARRLKDRSIPSTKMGGRVLIPIGIIDELVHLANQNIQPSRRTPEGEAQE